jgi:hypothetical protein
VLDELRLYDDGSVALTEARGEIERRETNAMKMRNLGQRHPAACDR